MGRPNIMRTTSGLQSDQPPESVVCRAGLVISAFNDASGFERLRPEWGALKRQGEEQDPFLSCDWFAAWWRAFGGNHVPYLVTARQHGKLCAVLPLMLKRVRCHGIPLRRLAAMGNDHTPRFDLVRASDDERLYRSIWDYLMTLRTEWDVLDFPRLSDDSITAGRFVELAVAQNVRHSLWQRAPRSPWIDVQPSWAEYLEFRSSGFRKSLRRKMRRLTALGRVRLETLTGGEALEKGLADGLYIEAEGWKGSNNTAILSQPAVAGFYKELAEKMAAREQLRLHFLTLDNVRIAFDYSLVANRCLYTLKAGHGSAHARFSPGTLLLGLIVQRAHEEGLVGVDLLGDTDEFKMHWTDATRTHPWLHCYSGSMRAILFHAIKCRLIPFVSKMRSGDR